MYNDSFTPFDDIQCEDMIDIHMDDTDLAMEDLQNDPDFIDGVDAIIGDSDDCAGLFDEEGGLTAAAFGLLSDMDRNGEFI